MERPLVTVGSCYKCIKCHEYRESSLFGISRSGKRQNSCLICYRNKLEYSNASLVHVDDLGDIFKADKQAAFDEHEILTLNASQGVRVFTHTYLIGGIDDLFDGIDDPNFKSTLVPFFESKVLQNIKDSYIYRHVNLEQTVSGYTLAFKCRHDAYLDEIASKNDRNHGQSKTAVFTTNTLKCKGRLTLNIAKATKKVRLVHVHMHHDLKEAQKELPSSVIEYIEKYADGRHDWDTFATRILYEDINNKFPQFMTEKYKIDRVLKNYRIKKMQRDKNPIISAILKLRDVEDKFHVQYFVKSKFFGFALISRLAVKCVKKTSHLLMDSTFNIDNSKLELFTLLTSVDQVGVDIGYLFCIPRTPARRRGRPRRNGRAMSNISRIVQNGHLLSAYEYLSEIVEEGNDENTPDGNQETSEDNINTVGSTVSSQVTIPTSQPISQTTSAISTQTSTQTNSINSQETDNDGIPNYNMSEREYSERTDMITWFLDLVEQQGFNPVYFGTDKDKGQHISIKSIFPDTFIRLCMWHMKKAVFESFKKAKTVTENSLQNYFTRAPEERLVPNYRCWSKDAGQYGTCTGCGNEDFCPRRMVGVNRREKSISFSTTEAFFEQAIRIHSRRSVLFPVYDPTSETSKFLNYTEHITLCLEEILSWCKANDKYGVFLYLWKEWYQPDRRKNWMRLEYENLAECDPIDLPFANFDTTMLNESAHNRLKSKQMLNRNANAKLDNSLHIIVNDLYNHQLMILRHLFSPNRTHCYRGLEPSWRKDMSRFFKITIRKAVANHLTQTQASEAALRTYVSRYSTNPIEFVCGCMDYLRSRLHMCRHIMAFYDVKELGIKHKFGICSRFRNEAIMYPKIPFWRHPSLMIRFSEGFNFPLRVSTSQTTDMLDFAIPFDEITAEEIQGIIELPTVAIETNNDELETVSDSFVTSQDLIQVVNASEINADSDGSFTDIDTDSSPEIETSDDAEENFETFENRIKQYRATVFYNTLINMKPGLWSQFKTIRYDQYQDLHILCIKWANLRKIRTTQFYYWQSPLQKIIRRISRTQMREILYIAAQRYN